MRTWLRNIRNLQKLSEAEVASRVGIAQPCYHRIETGTQNPRVETAKNIARVLGFQWTLFYQGDDPD